VAKPSHSDRCWASESIGESLESLESLESTRRASILVRSMGIRLIGMRLRPILTCSSHQVRVKLNQDSDTWEDCDEYAHGEMDTEDNRRSFPDGFWYPCCEEQLGITGCTGGRHWAADDPGGINPLTDSEPEEGDDGPGFIEISDDDD